MSAQLGRGFADSHAGLLELLTIHIAAGDRQLRACATLRRARRRHVPAILKAM